MAELLTLIKSGFNTENYYTSMNEALRLLKDEYTMLHYPFHVNDNDDFFTAQKNLTDYCLAQVSDIKSRRVLEIGCGNGMQSIYILTNNAPEYILGIDLNRDNIKIAEKEAQKKAFKNIEFQVGDAQELRNIKNDSFDLVLNIESAFHYPDKIAFLNEISRVLKPGGEFLIADILKKPVRKRRFRKLWKRNMHLNHWEKETYDKEIRNAGLTVKNYSDITDKVIKGFKRYPLWMKTMKRRSFFHDQILRLFYTINILLNIRLLKSRRQYVVYSGWKEASGR
jgi:ubiquinone/menaquinone biosynthesis C-methylase UbiE